LNNDNTVLARSNISNPGAPHEYALLKRLVEEGVPASEWLKAENLHYIYDGLLDIPDSIPHPNGPDGRVAYAQA
jgi:hypothetical protein